jgi:alginate O-acetyltransferase complex protein AlgI
MIISILLNYIFALLVDKHRNRKVQVKVILGVSITLNLIILGVFKYSNFIVNSINDLLNTSISIPEIPLPLGISFFTFQSISYIVDIYRKQGEVQRNPLNVALYISFFPQLIAGPIVRYQTIADKIKNRKETIENFAEGIKRFIVGLCKKMFLANNCGLIADQIFSQSPAEISTGASWIGIIAYSLQIYFDFSAYSDMAIGLGKMFGFDFLENFNYPYISKSVSEFWRRWHISLGSWFRDYLYIPLGGNRNGHLKTYRNLLIVWLATGIWHGASWTFVAWGLYYGIFIMIERAFLNKWLSRISSIFSHIYLLFIVMIGWVFFRSDSFSYAFSYIKTMFGINGIGIWDSIATFYFVQYDIVLIISIIGATPFVKILANKFEEKFRIFGIVQILCYSILLFISVIYLVTSTFNPFIYFRF